jgi:hypothetical protein
MKLSPVRATLGQNPTVRQLIPQTMTMGIQGQRKATPKVTQIAQVAGKGSFVLHQKDVEGKVTIQEIRPIKAAGGVFVSNPGVIPVSISQGNNRGETLQVS